MKICSLRLQNLKNVKKKYSNLLFDYYVTVSYNNLIYFSMNVYELFINMLWTMSLKIDAMTYIKRIQYTRKNLVIGRQLKVLLVVKGNYNMNKYNI